MTSHGLVGITFAKRIADQVKLAVAFRLLRGGHHFIDAGFQHDRPEHFNDRRRRLIDHPIVWVFILVELNKAKGDQYVADGPRSMPNDVTLGRLSPLSVFLIAGRCCSPSPEVT